MFFTLFWDLSYENITSPKKKGDFGPFGSIELKLGKKFFVILHSPVVVDLPILCQRGVVNVPLSTLFCRFSSSLKSLIKFFGEFNPIFFWNVLDTCSEELIFLNHEKSYLLGPIFSLIHVRFFIELKLLI